MEVRVQVRTNTRREKFERISENEFAISVREKAEGNAANRRLLELVALHFGVPKKSVRIIRGHRVFTKVISVG